MTSPQFGFLIGFLFICASWTIGFGEALLGLLVGVIVYLAIRAVSGNLDFTDVAERLSTITRR